MATQAQARSNLLDQLDGIGVSRQEYDTADVFTPAESAVGNFITRVQENINGADMIVTGGIADMGIKLTADSIQVTGNEYLLYQDKGVKGSISDALAPDSPYSFTDKMPPTSVFRAWIERKNINLKNEAHYTKKGHKVKGSETQHLDGKEAAIESAAYAMAKKVFEDGFKPRNVFSKEIPQLVDDLKQVITGFGADMIKTVFKQK